MKEQCATNQNAAIVMIIVHELDSTTRGRATKYSPHLMSRYLCLHYDVSVCNAHMRSDGEASVKVLAREYLRR
jgi:hypothetical protein